MTHVIAAFAHFGKDEKCLGYISDVKPHAERIYPHGMGARITLCANPAQASKGKWFHALSTRRATETLNALIQIGHARTKRGDAPDSDSIIFMADRRYKEKHAATNISFRPVPLAQAAIAR